MPVLVSPVVVIEGASEEPAGTTLTAPEILNVPVASGNVSVLSVLLFGDAMVNAPVPLALLWIFTVLMAVGPALVAPFALGKLPRLQASTLRCKLQPLAQAGLSGLDPV